MKRQAAQKARRTAAQAHQSSSSESDEDDQSQGSQSDTTEHLKSIKLNLGDPLLTEHSPLLQELCKQGSAQLGGERLTFCLLINVLFELSSFPADLFEADELEIEDLSPEDICKAAIVRTQERGIEPCALSLLMISVGRKMNARRLGQLTSIFEEFNELSRWGVTAITRSTPEGVSKKLRTFISWCESSSSKEDRATSRVLSNVKLKHIEPLSNGLSNLISDYIGIALLDDEGVARVSKLVQWLRGMMSSSIRPLRLTAVVTMSIIVDCMLNKLTDALTSWSQMTSQYQTERNSGVKAVQLQCLHSMGRAIVSTVSLLLEDIWTEAQTRATDVSWLVISQTCHLLGTIAAAFPLRTLMRKDNRLVLLLTFLTRHDNPQVRAIALETSGKLIRTFLESGSSERFAATSSDIILPVPNVLPELQVYAKGLDRLCHVKPDPIELKSKLDRIWICVLRHLRDVDVRVGVCAGEILSVFGLLESEYKGVCGLQDDQISRACSLLFLVDNPCVAVRIAKFIDGALFAKSIIDEGEARRLMAGGSQTTLTPDQSVAMSTQLSTIVEWLVEYADDDNWRRYHLTGLKAFSTLAPVLQHWDNLWQHLCVAFSANTLTAVAEDAELFRSIQNVSGSWVSQRSAEALLTITLAMLEIRRFSINGISRYSQITDFRDLSNEENKCHWTAAELTSEGLDITSCGVELWQAKLEVNPKVLSSCKDDLIKALRYIPTILRCGKTSQRLQWLALSLTFEIVDGIKGLGVNLEAQVEGDTSVLKTLQTIASITYSLMDGLDNWLSLQGCFSLLRKITAIAETTNDNKSTDLQTDKEQLAKSLTTFLDTYRTATVEKLGSNAHTFLMKLEQDKTTENDEEALSSSLVLTNILASNDTTNTYRSALETLDDLISIVEYRCTNTKPSDRVTSQILDVVWSALTRWCTQLEIRFLAHIHPAVAHLTDNHQDESADLLTRFEDKLVSFKEDMDIYKELSSQFMNFAAKMCETFRLKLRKLGDDISHELERKAIIIGAVRIVKYIILSSYYHTMTSLWYLIQRDMMSIRRMTLSSVITLNVLDTCKEIEALCISCRETPPTESTQEVSYFVDFLKTISTGVDRSIIFDVEWLENGLLAQFHTPRNLLPQSVNTITVCDAYSTLMTDTQANTFLKNLPATNVLANNYHVQLLACLCQVPDVSLWKDATVGPVILSYLRGKSLILQELAKIFMGRVILYDKIRRQKLDVMKGASDADSRQFIVINDSPLLITLVLSLLPPMLERAREKGNNKDINILAQRIGTNLPPSYFVDLPTSEFINVLWMTTKTSWQEKFEDGQNCGYLLELFSDHLFHNKLIKRKWTPQEAKEQADALKEYIREEFDKARGCDGRVSLSDCCGNAYHAAFERFMHLSFGGILPKASFKGWLPKTAAGSSSASSGGEETGDEMETETMVD